MGMIEASRRRVSALPVGRSIAFGALGAGAREALLVAGDETITSGDAGKPMALPGHLASMRGQAR